MKKQVRYQDQKYNQASPNPRLEPTTPQGMNVNQNNAVQLLIKNKIAQSSPNKPKGGSQIINKQFFNPTSFTYNRPTGPTLSSKFPVELEIGPKFVSMSNSPSQNLPNNPDSRIDSDVKSQPSSLNRSSRSKNRKLRSKNSQAQTQEFLRYGRSSKSRPASSRRSLSDYQYSDMESGPRPNPFLVQEAAAKLSFPWPSPAIYEPALNTKQASAEDYLILSQKRTQALKDIHNFFENHQDLVKLPGVKSIIRKVQNVSDSDSIGRMGSDDPLEAAINALKRVFLKNGLPIYFPRVAYKPVEVPKWEETVSNWPGFESKPVPNWADYAAPSKIMPLREPKLKKEKGKKKGGVGAEVGVRWKDDLIVDKTKSKAQAKGWLDIM